MKKASLLFFAAWWIPVFAAPAPTLNFVSTEQIVQMCKNKDNQLDQGYCGGFGQGVYEGYLQMSSPKKTRETICIPKETKDTGIVQAFIAWTETNPQYNKKPASETVLNFLDQRYPCKK